MSNNLHERRHTHTHTHTHKKKEKKKRKTTTTKHHPPTQKPTNKQTSAIKLTTETKQLEQTNQQEAKQITKQWADVGLEPTTGALEGQRSVPLS